MEETRERSMEKWTSLQETMCPTKKRAMKALINEYITLLTDPAEGFVVRVEDPFNWDVGIYGPPSTPYWGGYFKLHVSFPDEYPFQPPKLQFKCQFWHPNVYDNGTVCMSILHGSLSEEVPSDLPVEEKWNPTLSVRTVLLSLISIMGSPNPDSPANMEATKMYRLWVEDGDDSYVKLIGSIVRRSRKAADKDGVTIPSTLEEYVTKIKPKTQSCASLVDYTIDSDEESSDFSTSSSSINSSDLEPYDSGSSINIATNSRTSTEPEESTPSSNGLYLEGAISLEELPLTVTQPCELRSIPRTEHNEDNQTEQPSIIRSNRENTSQTSLSLSSSSIRKRRPPPLRLFPNSDPKKRKRR